MDSARPSPIEQANLTVDVVIFTVSSGQLCVSLVQRSDPPFAQKLALPGGFIWKAETAAAAAQRILRAKVGAGDVFFEQLYTFDDPKRDPRGRIVSVAFFALVPDGAFGDKLQPGIRMVPVQLAGTLAFDHTIILAKAIARVRNKLLYSNIAYSLLPPLFTLSQLQTVYETVLGKPLDKRNFRKKIMSLDLVVATNQRTPKARHRPAVLYKFKKHGYTELDEPAF